MHQKVCVETRRHVSTSGATKHRPDIVLVSEREPASETLSWNEWFVEMRQSSLNRNWRACCALFDWLLLLPLQRCPHWNADCEAKSYFAFNSTIASIQNSIQTERGTAFVQSWRRATIPRPCFAWKLLCSDPMCHASKP